VIIEPSFDDVHYFVVTAGLVPAISLRKALRPDRDGRDKPGHDGELVDGPH
jgi:hypothetical protein